ncbi:zinc finger protein [Saccharothrix lopnurensis]|uniref:Zinc finger protein n=1 Tax=Saccharothrix lopnurensis TaxID=1670621 RepID=A0ABW1PEB7_9PSEU
MTQPFRWYPHDGERHAIPVDAGHGECIETLCHKELVMDTGRRLRCEATCAECDSTWRAAVGIPPQSRRQAFLLDPLDRSTATSADVPVEASR